MSGHDQAAYGGAPAATGTANDATVTASTVFPTAVDGGNRYLVRSNGNAWFGVGDSAWSLCTNLSTANITVYLEDRASRGINFVLTNLVEHLFSDNAPNNINNDSPFTGTAFQSSLRNAYWLVVDHMFNEALRLGITILACPAYLGFPASEEGWDTEVVAAGNTNMGTYGTNLASRYPSATYPNIIWLIGHDRAPSSTEKAREQAMEANLPAAHLRMPGGATNSTGKSDWASSGITFTGGDTIYSYLHDEGTTAASRWTANAGPFGFLEGKYENEGDTDQQRRHTLYSTWCEGGTFAFFGNTPIWKLDTGWQSALSSTGSVQLSYLATVIAAIGTGWGAAVPDTTNTFQTTGSGECRFSTSLGLVYTTTGATIDLSEISTATALVRWFDPTAGTFTTVGTFANSAGRVVSDPGANSGGDQDWLLVVTAV